MKCLIVAAGQGSRLREPELKPLVPLLGVPLIEHVIRRARGVGVEEFVVVNGYRGAELRVALDALAGPAGVRVEHVGNEDWRGANGTSVLRAAPHLDAPFLLLMCDHVVDPAILRELMAGPAEAGTVALAVDHAIASPLNDADDATRVRCAGGRIERIGKGIEDYNAFDTGVFLCTTAMFAALEESGAAGDDSLTGAMRVLARGGRAHARDIGERLWIDVDDQAAHAKAEALMRSGRL